MFCTAVQFAGNQTCGTAVHMALVYCVTASMYNTRTCEILPFLPGADLPLAQTVLAPNKMETVKGCCFESHENMCNFVHGIQIECVIV